MFAVQGWSLPAASIKSETAAANPSDPERKAKKRRRPNANKQDVTNDNVADLWQKVIEQKDSGAPPAKEKKNKNKKFKTHDKNVDEKTSEHSPSGKSEPGSGERKKKREHEEDGAEDEEWGGFDDEIDDGDLPKAKKAKKKHTKRDDGKQGSKDEVNQPAGEPSKPKKEKKNKNKDTDKNTEKAVTENSKPDADQTTTAATTTPQPAVAKLTPLQASMREKLISARFRHLNETLYTRPSAEAYKLFADSPEMFAEYHEGFRRQVGVWPENPVSGYIAEIQARGRVKPSRFRREPPPSSSSSSSPVPLPRTDGTCVIADLGCGDAALAAALQPVQRKLSLDIRSYDLQSPSPLVTRADIANLPLPNGSVDVAVFCLALMGTNWVDFVEEAYRVLRWKGELWIAEIKSRFAAAGPKGKKQGGSAVVEHSVGNRKKGAAAAGKKAKAAAAAEAAGAEAEVQLAVEVDGVEDRRQETNVSAFVDTLARRGFVLRGEPSEAVDLDNKMFVKMYFIKGATPTKGKGVPPESKGGPRQTKKKFIPNSGDEDGPVDESAILKPCVYKIR